MQRIEYKKQCKCYSESSNGPQIKITSGTDDSMIISVVLNAPSCDVCGKKWKRVR